MCHVFTISSADASPHSNIFKHIQTWFKRLFPMWNSTSNICLRLGDRSVDPNGPRRMAAPATVASEQDPNGHTRRITQVCLKMRYSWYSHVFPIKQQGKWMKMVGNYQIWAPLVTLRTQKNDWKGVMGIGTPSFDLYWASTCCKTFPYPSWHANLSMDASAAHTKV